MSVYARACIAYVQESLLSSSFLFSMEKDVQVVVLPCFDLCRSNSGIIISFPGRSRLNPLPAQNIVIHRTIIAYFPHCRDKYFLACRHGCELL